MSYGSPQARAGVRDRKLQLYRASVTLNAMNEPEKTYVVGPLVWAEVKNVEVREIYSAESMRASKYKKFRILYRTDITEKDRIKHDDGKMYKILGLTEIGRKELLEIFAESMEGQPE